MRAMSAAALQGFDRFQFIAEALDACGGFKPQVIYRQDENCLIKPDSIAGTTYLVPYPRESMLKFAARCAVSVYENHLRTACERFNGFLGRKQPQRSGTDGQAASMLLEDADYCGNSLDVFWQGFMIEAKARGSMLLLVDMPKELPPTLDEQLKRRAVPYLTAVKPERVVEYTLNERGRFDMVAIRATYKVNGKDEQVVRRWTASEWTVELDKKVIDGGPHPFKACPMLAFTEHGLFPCYGSFEQVAQLSRRHYNAQSELDEILRSQTFSLLTYQVPPEAMPTFNAAGVAATIGTHNMMVHSGDAPEFIAPGDGPAKTYMERIAQLDAAIRNAGLSVDDTTQQAAESGLALQMRFETLNAALTTFASRMQDLERQMWDLFAAGMNTSNSVKVDWPRDYSLADIKAALDVLTAMQATGFPDEVLIEKRKQITAAEFSGCEQSLIDELLAAVDQPTQEPAQQDTPDPNQPGV